MKKWPFFVAIGVAIAIILGCAAKQAPVEPPKKAHVFSLPPLERPITLSTVDDANSLCDINLAHAERLKKEILAASGQRTRENTLERMNEIYIALERILYTTSLTSYTHPDKDVREASEACERRAMEVYNALNMNPDLYAAVKAVDVASLDAPARRFVQIVLRDYERSGVNKDQSVRERLAVLSQAMVQSSQDFSRNVREDVRSIKLTPEQLAGLPEDFMAQRPADEDGLITITTNAPDLFPVLTYAKDEKTREALVRVNASRAYPANEPILTNYLQQRHEYANLVGFDSWAAYNADNKMAKNPKTIQGFIDEIAGITRPRAGEEIETFMALKRLDNPETDGFYSWDRFFYIETLKRQQHDVDSQVVRQYFPYERVKRGIMGVISQIYGVTFQQSDRPVWHDSVEAYDIYDGDKLIAFFYLDMHPRDGKYKHAAMFSMNNGIEGLQLPAASLVCNFPEPTPSNPAYMEHNDVTTFFHEFGHLMHHLFAGRHHWSNQSGISTEWDFVEVPSQLFEDWAWDYDVLKRFAVNTNGDIIGRDLVERMNKSDSVGKGVMNMRQISFAAFSLGLYNIDPKNINILAKQRQVFAKYSPFKPFDGDYSFASFGHLDGYSSGYYTYMWSLSIAKDVASVFHEKGLMNPDVAHRFRALILGVGGSMDAADMVRNFLGRDYNLDAFRAWLAE